MSRSRNSQPGKPHRCSAVPCCCKPDAAYRNQVLARAERRDQDAAAAPGIITFCDWHDMFCGSCGNDYDEYPELECDCSDDYVCAQCQYLMVTPLRVALEDVVRVT